MTIFLAGAAHLPIGEHQRQWGAEHEELVYLKLEAGAGGGKIRGGGRAAPGRGEGGGVQMGERGFAPDLHVFCWT